MYDPQNRIIIEKNIIYLSKQIEKGKKRRKKVFERDLDSQIFLSFSIKNVDPTHVEN
jgi:hypothetical protein